MCLSPFTGLLNAGSKCNNVFTSLYSGVVAINRPRYITPGTLMSVSRELNLTASSHISLTTDGAQGSLSYSLLTTYIISAARNLTNSKGKLLVQWSTPI